MGRAKRLVWLPVANLIAAITTCLIILARNDWALEIPVMRFMLDVIARASLVWFLLAFVARPLNDVLHNKITRWLLKHRRYLGLSFAAWFLQHLWILPVMGRLKIFEIWWTIGFLVLPGILLLTATALALTSFDRAQRSLPIWKDLHWIGIQGLWLWFTGIYTKIFLNFGWSLRIIFLPLLLAAQVLRIVVYFRERRR